MGACRARSEREDLYCLLLRWPTHARGYTLRSSINPVLYQTQPLVCEPVHRSASADVDKVVRCDGELRDVPARRAFWEMCPFIYFLTSLDLLASALASMSVSKVVLSRNEIAGRIIQGDLLLIYRSAVVNATSWASFHPGGVLALLHFVGRDATDEIEAYHPPASIERLDRLVVGRVDINEEEGWRPLTPPIALGLEKHPNGVKGHWIREGAVSLGEATLQRGSSLDDPSYCKPSTQADVITLHPAQLEPAPSGLDPKVERLRSKAYHDLKDDILKAGLFDRPGPLAGYGSDLLRYIFLGAAAFGLFFLYVDIDAIY